MTDMPAFTARNVSKFIVTSIIALKTADAAENVITDHTRFEEDDLVASLGSKLIGWCVADTVKPYSDKMVDKTADFVATKRANRKAKKAAKKSETTE
jgi:hypothetical protein